MAIIQLPLFVRPPFIRYRCGLDVFIAPLGGVIGKSMKLLEDFMHWHLPWFKLVAVVVPYHHRVQVLLLQTRARIRLDVVHEREDALSLGSVDRNEQHEDHKAEHVALMCEF